MGVKHKERVQRGLVLVLSSCTHGFPAGGLQSLTLGGHGWGWGTMWKTVEEALPLPRVHCPWGSEPRAEKIRGGSTFQEHLRTLSFLPASSPLSSPS